MEKLSISGLENRRITEVSSGQLQRACMQISMAGNGQEALEMVQAGQYDLVLMDHYMPVMDGVEATKQIRMLEQEEKKGIPIVALTADALKGTKEKFLAAERKNLCKGKLSHYK